ncbi:hypothetical protein ACG3SL_09340 [Sphingomonas sp. CJ20]
MARDDVPASFKAQLRRCPSVEKDGSVVSRPDRECVAFSPQREFSGLWISAFEGSEYFDGARSAADLPAPEHGGGVWFETDATSKLPAHWAPKDSQVYRVRFLGREAADGKRPPGLGYGHFGMFAGMVLVDELRSIEDLGPYPPAE